MGGGGGGANYIFFAGGGDNYTITKPKFCQKYDVNAEVLGVLCNCLYK